MNRVVALGALLGTSFVLRFSYDRIYDYRFAPIPIGVALADFGLRELSGGLRAEDIPLDPRVERVAGVDDYLNRTYSSSERSIWFYIGYVSGWRPESIHYPDVCFPSQGMELVAKATIDVLIAGRPSPARFHEYIWDNPSGKRTYTLSSFYFRGKFEPSKTAMRLERSLGIRYFVMVTISGPVVGDVEASRMYYSKMLEQLLPEFLTHMPKI
jgi:hypothetical protein